MAMIGFKNTHNQDVFVNPAQVLYVVAFEDDVTVIAFAITGVGGKPHAIYVRGHLEFVRQRIESGEAYPSKAKSLPGAVPNGKSTPPSLPRALPMP